MLAICGCGSKYQDELYGKGMRVFNVSGKDGSVATCTVCGKKRGVEKGGSGGVEKAGEGERGRGGRKGEGK